MNHKNLSTDSQPIRRFCLLFLLPTATSESNCLRDDGSTRHSLEAWKDNRQRVQKSKLQWTPVQRVRSCVLSLRAGCEHFGHLDRQSVLSKVSPSFQNRSALVTLRVTIVLVGVGDLFGWTRVNGTLARAIRDCRGDFCDG